MPASPSFPSDGRGRWRKRKREPPNARKPKPEEDDEDEEEEEELEQEDDEDPHTAPRSTPAEPLARESEVLSDGGYRISDFPAAVRHAVNRPHSSVLAIVALERAIQCGDDPKNQTSNPISLENISYGQLQALSAVPTDSPSLGTNDPERMDAAASSSYVITPPQIMEGRGVVKRFSNNRVLVLPMHADWFSTITVNRLERQVVPHFFSGKSLDHTPERYMECRNGIVANYMENPEKKLLVPDCQGVMAGMDMDDFARIFRFLEHWGIINYCVVEPKREPWNVASYLKEDFNGEVHVPSTALKSIESLVQFDRPKCKLKAADAYASSIPCSGEDISDLDSRIREQLSEHRCNHCSQPIPAVFYQSQKEVDVLLCSDCFHEGRFVVGHSSIDFMRLESAKDYGDVDGETWTDQETLLLLEALEIHSDNWNDIAEHVGSKSKAQCILHFIRLPIDDGVMENIEVPGMTGQNSIRENRGRAHLTSNGNSTGPCFKDPNSKLPFANSGNPVMSLVAFLASAVGPRVAAACAHASLAALSEDDPMAISGSSKHMEGSGHVNRMDLENICRREGGSRGDFATLNQQKAQSPLGQNDGMSAPLSSEKVEAAAKVGLSAAAMKAKLFADHEEREIQRLSANIINHQLKRLELKLKQFAEVETLLMKECEQVERARLRFASERTRILSTRFGPSGINSSLSSLPGAAPSGINTSTTNSRQQVATASPSQSGFSNSQTIHPHMSFMPRQPMFGAGPRLPLAAINPSSSAQSNVMFSSPGNAQPNLSHPMLRPIPGTSSGLG